MDNFDVTRGDYWQGFDVNLTLDAGTNMSGATVLAQLRKKPESSTVAHDFVASNNYTLVANAGAGTLVLKFFLPKTVTAALKGLYYFDVQVEKTSVFEATTLYSCTLTFIGDVSRP